MASCLAVGLLAPIPYRFLQSRALEDLTVPAARMPPGCSLPPTAAMRTTDNRVRAGLWAGLPIDRNPWIGSDSAITAAIRERIDPPSRLPDGPPLDTGQLARYRLQLADGVDRAYAAVYLDSRSGELVVTYALQFPSDRDALDFRDRARISAPAEVVTVGSAVVLISGGGGACLDAVRAHLQSLK